jgi:hypothetical protein
MALRRQLCGTVLGTAAGAPTAGIADRALAGAGGDAGQVAWLREELPVPGLA